MSAAPEAARAILYALGANLAIALAKYAAAAATGSGSMLAEAVHSTADCGNQLLLMLGMRRAKRPPTPDHPLGHGKETYFWSFIVALLLFSVGGLFSIYEGCHKLGSREPVTRPLIALGVLAFSIAAESISMWGVMREVGKVRGERGLLAWLRETRDSELVVVLGEDFAALVGLVLAFAAVAATAATGHPGFDAAGSIAVGILLVGVAAAVAIQVKSLLVGQGVEPAEREAMVRFLAAQPAVAEVIEVLTLHMGGDVMVAVKARMDPQPSVDALVREINAIEAALRARFPKIRWVFFEPDVR
ncbi:MAG TPA: cation diffusion facilitator family transporter [Usitatibacter sp.]|nr:cation diffusion facilitator family transporter [Usitatibacter sp.]